MLHNLITVSTTFAVVLHALLGCCMHHAHADHAHSHGGESVTVMMEHHSHDHSHHHACEAQPNADTASHAVCGNDSDNVPCSSGSHGPDETCDEPNCNIVADQRARDVSMMLTDVWSPLLTDHLLLSAQDVDSLRMEFGSPPHPHVVCCPLRVTTQVWRL